MWHCAKVEEIIEKRPKLGVAFLKVLAQREHEFGGRLESLSLEKIPVRAARSLMGISEGFGTPAEDGMLRMRSFTQEFMAQYVGTSRELVNTCMSQFRRQGSLKYSRQEIVIDRDALREGIRQNR